MPATTLRKSMWYLRANGRTSVKARQQRILGVLLALPALALIGLFVLYPMAQTIRYSFYDWDGFSPDMTFAGLRMYSQSLTTLGFPQALEHSALWGLVGLLIPPTLGLVTAALVENSRIQPKALFRFAFFLPYFFSMAVASAIFARVYDPSNGLIDRFLAVTGIHTSAIQWLGSQSLALPASMVVFIWHETPFCFIIFMAAIQQIDRDLSDSARIDGASAVAVFRYITVPGVRNIASFVMLVMLIGGIAPFATLYGLGSQGLGGPYYATEVLPSIIFKIGMQGSSVGIASAMSVIMLGVVVFVTASFYGLRSRLFRES